MNLSEAGLELLKKSEGFRNRTYLDVVGIATIGYGHRLLPSESFPDGIDEARGAAMLADDVRDAEQAVGRLVKVPLSQGQFDALVDFVFNLGSGRLAGSSLLKDLNAGKYDAAAGQFLLWDHAGSREVAALKSRREAEVQLWEGTIPQIQACEDMGLAA
jgi:lysozyme